MSSVADADRVASVRAIAERCHLGPGAADAGPPRGGGASSATSPARTSTSIADVLNLSVAEVHGVVTLLPRLPHRRRRPRTPSRSAAARPARRWAPRRCTTPTTRRRAGGLGDDVEVDEVFCLGNCALGPSGHARRPPARPARRRPAGRADRGVAAHDRRVFVPGDAAAGLGRCRRGGRRLRGAPARTVVRNGSRGMLWLEPLVEVDTDGGRVGYANVDPRRRRRRPRRATRRPASASSTSTRGSTSQRRVSFARVGVVDPASIADYEAHGGWAGLRRALSLSPAEVVQEVTDSGPARPRRRRLPGRHQVADRPRDRRPTRSSSPATSTRATPARSPTGWSSRATRSPSSRA